MTTIIEFVPSGLTSDNTSFIHEIIEDYLYNQWTDTDAVPRNTIRFSYKLDQNVVFNAKNALKCYDAGTNIESMVTNDSAMIHYTDVNITIETRAINNLINDIPVEIHGIKKKILNVINGNKTALRSSGIHLMNIESNEMAIQDDKNPNVYTMTLNLRATQFMDKKITVV
jgi:hypothetical protein